MNSVSLFGISIHNLTMDEAVDAVLRLSAGTDPTYVVTPNVDHVIKLQNDPVFRDVYADAALVLADGMPVVWVSRWVGQPLKERVTGADLFLRVCERAGTEGRTVFLLGSASQEIIEKTGAELGSRYPGLKIVGTHSPSFGFENKPEELAAIGERIRQAAPDILFVGVGAPKQEKWIWKEHLGLGVPVSLGVGAAFDFVAGSVKRAPLWMQRVGLEWFYRFLKEPKRMFQRYFVDDMKFFHLAMIEKKKAKKALP